MADRWCVIDDAFPNLLTGFRVGEYHGFLAASDALTVYGLPKTLREHGAAYAQAYPQFAGRVRMLTRAEVTGSRLGYVNFLNNAELFMRVFVDRQMPFVVTLFPGGGFGLREPESDAKLDRVIRSPLFRGVITTQTATDDYLADRHPQARRRFLYGGALPAGYFAAPHRARAMARPRYARDKPTLDICFAADKYMPDGANKGYPLFLAAAEQLARSLPDARFHVIGGFGPEDLTADIPTDRLSFHGRLLTPDLQARLLGMDIIVSPNQPFTSHPGNFDGFPTGCCAEASLCGVAMAASDPLGLNPGYVDGESIALVAPRVADIVARVMALAADPAALAALGEAGRRLSLELFAPERQVRGRLDFLAEVAADEGLDLGLG